MGSWEPHRQVCEVRIDLDRNDSQGRAGPHFRNQLSCVDRSPICDADVRLWSVDERPFDSLAVRITTDAGPAMPADILSYRSVPDLRVDNTGDTLLRVYPLPGTQPTVEDFQNWLRQVELLVTDPDRAGIRTVRVSAWAGGLRADPGRAFVSVRPDLPTAGADRTFTPCRGVNFQPLREILRADRLAAGGRFEPPLLAFADGRPYFNSDSLPYGTYFYIHDEPGCRPDTARIELLPSVEQLAIVPQPHDTVYLCPGTSYDWTPAAAPELTLALHDNSSFEETRRLSAPGTYRALVSYEDLPSDQHGICDEWLSMTVIYDETGSMVIPLDTTICGAQTLTVGGQTFDRSGRYEVLVAGAGDCDTLYDLTLRVVPDKELSVFIDTVRCDDRPIWLADTLVGLPGTYRVERALTASCTVVTTIRLRRGGSVRQLDTVVTAPGGLAVGDTVLFAPGFYAFTLTDQLGCDSIVYINLDILSGVGEAGPGERERYRVVNPITSAANFQVVDDDGQSVELIGLQLFTTSGRPVDVHSGRLPGGVYFYRFRPAGSAEWYTGKVMVGSQ